MSKNYEVFIKRFIVHVLDPNLQVPVISEREHPLNSEVIEFLEKHIKKTLNDDSARKAYFEGENEIKNICIKIKSEYDRFSTLTANIATRLFAIMQKHVDIPAADLVCCLFTVDNMLHLGLFKLNYKYSFSHYVQSSESERLTSIVRKNSLPGTSQKIEECAIISLEDFSIQLIEKKYEVNGEKIYYFSTLFLNCITKLSSTEKAKIFTGVTEKFNRKYFEEDFIKPVEIKKAVAESIEETGTIDIADVAEEAFGKMPDLKNEYLDAIEKAGIKEKAVTISESIADKSFKLQKLRTDNGFEVNFPAQYYGDKNKIEFVNGPDGMISIVIKNIGQINSR